MKIKIRNKIIGNGRQCFIIAEISGNHNGNINFAKKLIYNAKKSGADAVKLQTYKPENLLFELTRWAINKNIILNELSVSKPSLEDTYLKLVNQGHLKHDNK